MSSSSYRSKQVVELCSATPVGADQEKRTEESGGGRGHRRRTVPDSIAEAQLRSGRKTYSGASTTQSE
jgi:hypothetical protein